MASLAGTALAEHPARAAADGRPLGHDVSSHQKHVDWRAARAKGARFVYAKATESDGYRNPYFSAQYDGSRAAGLLRGAYHFAVPSASSGTAQARYFLRHGGHWKADGWTLPPALDIEHNPHDARQPCFGLGRSLHGRQPGLRRDPSALAGGLLGRGAAARRLVVPDPPPVRLPRAAAGRSGPLERDPGTAQEVCRRVRRKWQLRRLRVNTAGVSPRRPAQFTFRSPVVRTVPTTLTFQTDCLGEWNTSRFSSGS
ncbi:lysozyme precursor [Streptomyces sp. 769]|nr:lysozyme precursor [Streptomyces sp. 769]